MKNLAFLVVLIVIFTSPVNAQFDDWGTKYGFRGSILFPENEFANLGVSGNDNLSFDWFKFSYLIEAFYAFEINHTFELQINGGYGSYAGAAYKTNPGNSLGEYQTTIIPIHLKLKIIPFDLGSWKSFLFVGGGAMNYSVKTKTALTDGKPIEQEGWTAIMPAGAGAEFALSNDVLLELSIGGAVASAYGLDGYKTATNATWDASLNLGVGLTFVGESCSSDNDEDGLGKCDEEKSGTDSGNPDSDNDGLKDGEEVLTYETNPSEADTDLDGLSDYDEVTKIKSNPLTNDTDADGLKDGSEVFEYKTNPASADTDADGLTDGDEILKYSTNPLKNDTDEEGLADGDEVLKYKSDPLITDTDGDGLFDGEEVMKYKTDPANNDSDGGTVNDLTELERGTNPMDADDDVVKIGVPIILDGVTFASGKADITPESAKILKSAFHTLNTHPEIQIEISGHTDNAGNKISNTKLSQRRADAIREWLIDRGVDSGRIVAKGYGPDNPIVPNDTEDNKRKNRRIEFKRIK